MSNPDTNRIYMRRLTAKHRQIPVNKRKTQADLHFKKKKKEIRQLTKAERQTSQKRQQDRKEYANNRVTEVEDLIWNACTGLANDLGRTPEHWKRVLMQNSRLERLARKISHWNAFVAIALDEINAG